MIRFRGPELTAPNGCIIGVIEEGAATLEAASEPAEGNSVLRHPLATASAFEKQQTVTEWIQRRRGGATVVLISHDEGLLESCADEIWWVRDGMLAARGDPGEVLAGYRRSVSERLRAAGEGEAARLAPAMRKGDGRAELQSVELIGESGGASSVWRSGEEVAIRVTVKFRDRVESPVVGIMIRTRIGLNVYGTNTELENLRLGPVESGALTQVTYRFRCDLCPGEYTVTAASHNPDGLWHDWMEDAVAFSVTDSRYTAGVANLRARVSQGQSAST